MGFLNTDSMPRLVEKLSDGDNIRISGNSKGNRVGTVVKKIVEKADDVTKAIEQEVINDSYSFKVGTGDVDVSSDVKDGFGEVGVKGVTYQNLFINCNNSNCFNNYIHWSVVAENTFEVVADGTNKYLFIKKANMLLKPSTQYTFIFEVLENTLVSSDEGSYVFTIFGSSGSIVGGVALTGSNVKTTVFLKTTVSDLDTAVHGFDSYLNNRAISGKLKVRLTMLEGDHTNNPNLPSYFEGIVGVGDKSKNLFNPTTVKNNVGVDISNGNEVANAIRKYSDFIDVIPSKYSFEVEGNCKFINIFVFDSNKNLICATHGNGTLVGDIKGTIDFSKEIFKGVKYIRILLANSTETNIVGNEVYNFYLNIGESVSSKYQYYDGYKIEILSRPNLADISTSGKTNFDIGHIRKGKTYSLKFVKEIKDVKYNLKYKENGVVSANISGCGSLGTEFKTFTSDRDAVLYYNAYATDYISEIMLVEGDYTSDNMPPFKPYQEDKTQILLDEPLMRLPNGVYDEITRDGKLIRRIGKDVFNGSENWRYYSDSNENFNEFWGVLGGDAFYTNNSIVNNIPQIANHRITRSNNSTVYIRLPKSYINNLEEGKQWLSENPVTVYYELATPIITELPAPYLRIFKDGHLTFNTLVAPESNHVVQLNKSAQIERSIREVQSLDSRVGKLESFYDDMMLETSHKLNLLTYDFEYTRERNGE